MGRRQEGSDRGSRRARTRRRDRTAPEPCGRSGRRLEASADRRDRGRLVQEGIEDGHRPCPPFPAGRRRRGQFGFRSPGPTTAPFPPPRPTRPARSGSCSSAAADPLLQRRRACTEGLPVPAESRYSAAALSSAGCPVDATGSSITPRAVRTARFSSNNWTQSASPGAPASGPRSKPSSRSSLSSSSTTAACAANRQGVL